MIAIKLISRQKFNIFITDVQFLPYKDFSTQEHPTFNIRFSTHNFTSAHPLSSNYDSIHCHDCLSRKDDNER